MKYERVKRYLAEILSISAFAFLMGCGKTDGTMAGQDTAELPGGAYVSDEDAGSDQEADDSFEDVGGSDALEDAAEEPDDATVSSEPSITADADQSDDGILEIPEGGRRLTEEEMAGYTEWVRDFANYGFLLSEWQVPTEIDLFEVFYNGAGISHEGTEEQKQAFLDRYGQEEIYTDFLVMDKVDMNAFLLEKVGLTYDELLAKGNTELEEIYYPELDCFCLEVGDTNYCMFECTDGVENEEGTIVTLIFQSDDMRVEKCQVDVNIAGGTKGILSNHIIEGSAIGAGAVSLTNTSGETACLIEKSVLDNLHTDADASAVENDYVLGDWNKITREALQGTWYHHPKDMGNSKEYDVVLQFDGEGAIVYYPAVGFYGEARYEWDVVDRSDRGLCPELAIYWRGTHDGELAWYILGISDAKDYFWCNGEVFYKQ